MPLALRCSAAVPLGKPLWLPILVAFGQCLERDTAFPGPQVLVPLVLLQALQGEGQILAHLLPLGVRFLEEAEADYIIQQGGWVSGHWTGDGWYILVGWDRGRTKNEPLINFSYEVQADKCFSLDLLAAVHSIARVGRQISTVHFVFVGNEF